MKKILKLIRRWRYHRLYQRLFWLYIAKTNTADEAGYQAENAFVWLTGKEWKDLI